MLPNAQYQTDTRSLTYDAGLRTHMLSVYNRMTLGVLITAITAYAVSLSPALLSLIFGTPLKWVVMLAPLAIIWFGFRPDRMSSSTLRLSFIGLSVVYGLSFSVIAAVASQDLAMMSAVARAFLLATIMFAGLSIFGYTTKKNLSAMGSFMIMGMFGLFFLSIINIFMDSSMVQNIICAVGIIVFGGLTAWETQSTKEMYNPNNGDEMNSRMSWAAALNLYISFVAMFQYILHFLQQNR